MSLIYQLLPAWLKKLDNFSIDIANIVLFHELYIMACANVSKAELEVLLKIFSKIRSVLMYSVISNWLCCGRLHACY